MLQTLILRHGAAFTYIGNLDDFFDFSNAQPFVPIKSNSSFCNVGGTAPNVTPAESRWLQMIHADDD